ncbi:MAG: hypothetical protein HY650_04480, partial [Acidobacteria bacterium]|nr:hypothetical protein [Acidobacteriota bacterium]
MSADRWQEIDRVYHSALELEPDVQTSFLEKACHGDEALRREVDSLLGHADEAENFIDEPALETVARGLADDHIEQM